MKNDRCKINIEKVRENLQKQNILKEKELDLRFNYAWKSFRKIVTLIIKKYHPKRIYQWGSLLKREHFSFISDIDIAVEGITCADTFFKMYGEAESLTTLPLDFIQIEKIDILHAKTIKENGRVVYEKQRNPSNAEYKK